MLERYKDLSEMPPNSADTILREGGNIDKDLDRTFPSNAYFAEGNGVGQKSLGRVLRAFANGDVNVPVACFRSRIGEIHARHELYRSLFNELHDGRTRLFVLLPAPMDATLQPDEHVL